MNPLVLVATNVGPFAVNVGLSTPLFAVNVVPKRGLFAGRSESYCGPLQLGGDRLLGRDSDDYNG